MKRPSLLWDCFLLTLLALLLWAAVGRAQPPRVTETQYPSTRIEPGDAPEKAVVRVTSHGASCVAIYSDGQCTYFLGCAHMFQNPQDRQRQLRLESARQLHAPNKLGITRVVAVDYQADLSLLVCDVGSCYYLPVAPAGYNPHNQAWSIGYDEMCWPPKKRRATLIGTTGPTTYTRERPWHGRSGGLLAETSSNYLVGIVQGYEHPPDQKPAKWNFREVHPPWRGRYVSHDTIVRFLSKRAPFLITGGPPRQQPLQPAPGKL